MDEGLKILVAYDGSKESQKALVEAIDLAKKFKGSVTALNVYWDPKETLYEETLSATENIVPADEGSLRILDVARKLLEESNVKHVLRTERDPNVPKTILRVAESEGFGCIALGSRGLGRASAWLLGSVSSRVIAEATCPVIVV